MREGERRYLCLIVTLMLTTSLHGCGSAVVIDDNDQSMGSNEGVVLTKIRTFPGTLTLSTDEVGTGRTVNLVDGDNFLALRLKAGGTYKLSKYAFATLGPYVFRCESAIEITPISGEITYIGDIDILAKFSRDSVVSILPIISDQEAITVTEFRKKYSILFEKYPYQKQLVQQYEDSDDARNLRRTSDVKSSELAPALLCRRFRANEALIGVEYPEEHTL